MTSAITDTQIKALRREARKAGDGLMADICAVALADGLGDTAEIDEANRAALEDMGIIPEHVGADEVARRECARVIADARAQQD